LCVSVVISIVIFVGARGLPIEMTIMIATKIGDCGASRPFLAVKSAKKPRAYETATKNNKLRTLGYEPSSYFLSHFTLPPSRREVRQEV